MKELLRYILTVLMLIAIVYGAFHCYYQEERERKQGWYDKPVGTLDIIIAPAMDIYDSSTEKLDK